MICAHDDRYVVGQRIYCAWIQTTIIICFINNIVYTRQTPLVFAPIMTILVTLYFMKTRINFKYRFPNEFITRKYTIYNNFTKYDWRYVFAKIYSNMNYYYYTIILYTEPNNRFLRKNSITVNMHISLRRNSLPRRAATVVRNFPTSTPHSRGDRKNSHRRATAGPGLLSAGWFMPDESPRASSRAVYTDAGRFARRGHAGAQDIYLIHLFVLT